MLNIEKYKNEILKCKSVCELEKLVSNLAGVAICNRFDFNCSKCMDYILRWVLEEYKEPILDDVEKKYLSNFIKPFKSRVINIALCGCSNRRFIRICVRRFDKKKDFERIELPCFKTGTMYKGMEDYKCYSLDELGL